MKRGKPLQRKTALNGGAPLRRGSPKRGGTSLSRTARVAPQSAKRQEDAKVRRVLVARLLRDRPQCEARWACQGARAVDVHERLTRARGGSIVDERHGHMIAVCRRCHDHITTHPKDAEARRLMLPSWHRCPPVGPC